MQRKKGDTTKTTAKNNNEKWEITPTLNGLLCACLTHQLVNWAAHILLKHNIFLLFLTNDYGLCELILKRERMHDLKKHVIKQIDCTTNEYGRKISQ